MPLTEVKAMKLSVGLCKPRVHTILWDLIGAASYRADDGLCQTYAPEDVTVLVPGSASHRPQMLQLFLSC